MNTAIKINAPSDRNGNPQRGWIITSPSGQYLGFIDEGYQGVYGLREAYPYAAEARPINVTAQEYRNWKSA